MDLRRGGAASNSAFIILYIFKIYYSLIVNFLIILEKAGVLYYNERVTDELGFVELFETNKQIEFVGTGVPDGPQIT